MENKRLYPDLDPFYRFSNVEYGAEIEAVASEDQQPKFIGGNQFYKDLNTPKDLADDATLLRRFPVIPSAPPLTDGGTSLLESLYSYIMEELELPPYTPNDPLSDNHPWTDDLQPDYDISVDDVTEIPEVNYNSNNLSSGDNDNPAVRGVENIIPYPVNDVENNKNNVSCNIDAQSKNNDKGAKNNTNDVNTTIEPDYGTVEAHSRQGRHIGKSNEYGAWVTWRKNVNRQLATVILLKRGGHVHLQKSDLSRRPLSRTSMDYVIRNARNGGKGSAPHATSLNGTPYIMYGIPRVALTRNLDYRPARCPTKRN